MNQFVGLNFIGCMIVVRINATRLPERVNIRIPNNTIIGVRVLFIHLTMILIFPGMAHSQKFRVIPIYFEMFSTEA